MQCIHLKSATAKYNRKEEFIIFQLCDSINTCFLLFVVVDVVDFILFYLELQGRSNESNPKRMSYVYSMQQEVTFSMGGQFGIQPWIHNGDRS